MEKYILSIDQGTTSSRAILFNHSGNLVAVAQKEISLVYPQDGYVEVNANDIFESVVDVIREVLEKTHLTFANIDSVGITNQRETAIVWSKTTGLPVCNAIVWQSRQSQSICDKFNKYQKMIHEKTGLLINPYFSASKIRYILDHIDHGQKRAESGELLFGTVDTWLIYKLTNGQVHATDMTNASRTMLYNINTLSWDEELLNLFNIPQKMLPEVKSCNADFGSLTIFNCDVHILGVLGDQQAALFGQTCFTPGESKATYGTGCFMLMNIGEKPVFSKEGLLTTIAWNIDGKTIYALEGSVFVCGTAIKWLRDGLQIINQASDCDVLANKVGNSNGVYFVPAFVGLGTPYWDNDVRGSFFGITIGTNRNHLVQATLQAIAFQCKDIFSIMEKESGIKITNLQVDGGVANSKYMLQFQSDILGVKVSKPCCLESTAAGAAFMAGLNSGYFKDAVNILDLHLLDKEFLPTISKKEAGNLYKNWRTAVKSAQSFKIKR